MPLAGKINWEIIINKMISNDNLQIYNFIDAVNQKNDIKDENCSYLDIAFIDEFGQTGK